MKKKKIKGFFDIPEQWEKEWQGMPEYKQTRLKAVRVLHMCFKSEEDIEAFGKLIGQNITPRYDTYWFPKLNMKVASGKKYVDESDES